MENTCYTNFKATNSKLVIRSTKDFLYLEALKSEAFHKHLVFTQNDKFDLDISQVDDKIVLKGCVNPLTISKINFISTCKVLIPFLISKKNFNKLSPIKTKTSKENKNINTLNKYFGMAESVMSFTQSFLSFDDWKKFTKINLFIHEKGFKNVHHYSIRRESITHENVDIVDFNALSNAIKKSKNRSFGQSSLKASSFKIIGTCLAEVFSLKEYSLIITFSKEDFLEQEEENIKKFNEFTKILSPFFYKLIKSKLIENKLSYIHKSLEQLPFSFSISSRTHSLFNKNANGNTLHFFKEFSKYELHTNLSERTDSGFADASQIQRISLLGELLNTLKHELSNPLFGVQLSSQLLEQEDFNPEDLDLIKEITLSINRCQEIITNFTDLYTKDEVVNLQKLIEEVFTLTKSRSRNIWKSVIIDNKTSEVLNSKKIILNTTSLVQIFFNLIINSSEELELLHTQSFSPKITFELSIKGEWLYIDIKDNGPGIQEDRQKEIFQPFYTTKKSGNGLGLSISKSLAKKLGGDLEYINNSNGAHFQLKLKL